MDARFSPEKQHCLKGTTKFTSGFKPKNKSSKVNESFLIAPGDAQSVEHVCSMYAIWSICPLDDFIGLSQVHYSSTICGADVEKKPNEH